MSQQMSNNLLQIVMSLTIEFWFRYIGYIHYNSYIIIIKHYFAVKISLTQYMGEKL